MQQIRILLADDFEPLVEKVRRLLADEFEIVGSVNNGQAAIEALGRLDPDLLVLEIAMPNLGGFEVIARLNSSGCRTRVILDDHTGSFASCALRTECLTLADTV